MEGGSTAGYFAIRMKSDVIYETEYNGAVTQEKYCSRPGLFLSQLQLRYALLPRTNPPGCLWRLRYARLPLE